MMASAIAGFPLIAHAPQDLAELEVASACDLAQDRAADRDEQQPEQNRYGDETQ
jgi:hypothetical protein